MAEHDTAKTDMFVDRAGWPAGYVIEQCEALAQQIAVADQPGHDR